MSEQPSFNPDNDDTELQPGFDNGPILPGTEDEHEWGVAAAMSENNPEPHVEPPVHFKEILESDLNTAEKIRAIFSHLTDIASDVDGTLYYNSPQLRYEHKMYYTKLIHLLAFDLQFRAQYLLGIPDPAVRAAVAAEIDAIRQQLEAQGLTQLTKWQEQFLERTANMSEFRGRMSAVLESFGINVLSDANGIIRDAAKDFADEKKTEFLHKNDNLVRWVKQLLSEDKRFYILTAGAKPGTEHKLDKLFGDERTELIKNEHTWTASQDIEKYTGKAYEVLADRIAEEQGAHNPEATVMISNSRYKDVEPALNGGKVKVGVHIDENAANNAYELREPLPAPTIEVMSNGSILITVSTIDQLLEILLPPN